MSTEPEKIAEEAEVLEKEEIVEEGEIQEQPADKEIDPNDLEAIIRDAAGIEDDVEVEETVGEEVSEEEEIVEPHDHWSDEDKEKFNALPEESKAYTMEIRKSLESGYDTKFQEASELRKEAESSIVLHSTVTEAFAPVKGWLDQQGIDEGTAIKQAAAIQHQLLTDPVGAIAYITKMYGSGNQAEIIKRQAQEANIDLFALDVDTQVQDPALVNLQGQVTDLGQQVGNMQNNQVTQSQQNVETELKVFAEATNEDGKLQYPNFEAVRMTMGQLMFADSQTGGGKYPTLESAYDAAVRLDDALFTERLEEEKQSALTAAASDKRVDAEKAKKASSSATSKSASDPDPDIPTVDPNDLDAVVKDAIQQHA